MRWGGGKSEGGTITGSSYTMSKIEKSRKVV